MESTLETEIKVYANRLGADLVGIANSERWQNAPEPIRPESHLPGARSVIVMGIHHPDGSVEFAGEPNAHCMGAFQRGMIPKLDTMSLRMARFLEAKSFRVIPCSCTGYWRHREWKTIDTNHTASFSHRHAAVAAGLGEIGWNNMLMTPRYGPRQRLVSVITDAPLKPDPLYSGPQLCDRCDMCVEHCTGGCFDTDLLPPGKDIVRIEDKTFEYAKLNHWNCIWSEQFGLDITRKPDHITEDAIYQALEEGVPRKRGSMGTCLRFCMSRPVRIWDREYSRAPRRKKERIGIDQKEKVARIRQSLVAANADYWTIVPTRSLDDSDIHVFEGYPWEKAKDLFPWVIAFGRKHPENMDELSDLNRHLLEGSMFNRLGMQTMDLCRIIDDWGDEAMQMWSQTLPLAEQAVRLSFPRELNLKCHGFFAAGDLKKLSEAIQKQGEPKC